MPEFPGTLKPPRLSAAPSGPVKGQMYFNDVANKLYWWNGTAWVDSTGQQGTVEVYEQATQPTSTNIGAIWIDTSTQMPVATRPFTYRDQGAA